MKRTPPTISFHRSRLPHWEVAGGLYFITMRLAGALPPEAAESIRKMSVRLQQLEGDARHEQRRSIFREMEEWLHRAEAVCHLAVPAVARMVMESIQHRHINGTWRIIECVVMPNHAHFFLSLPKGGLDNRLEEFKRWTGRQAARSVGLTKGRFWQRESFDHWSRSCEEDEKIIQYIRDNPVKAGLATDYLQWPYGSWNDPLLQKQWDSNAEAGGR